jgi:hypothetical protein
MNKSKIYIFSLLNFIILLGCTSTKQNIISDKEVKIIYTDILSGAVISIKKHKNIKEILFMKSDKSLFKILISNSTFINFNLTQKYKVKANKLLAINKESNKMKIIGKEVIIAPNFRVENCIYFYNKKFCETSIEIYEGLELMH